jgi:urease accessory protein
MPSTPISDRAQLVLLHLTDSALPTGGFSHSFGMEDYLLRGLVDSPDSFERWLHSYVRQTAHNEGLAARIAAQIAVPTTHGDRAGEDLRDSAGEDLLAEVAELDALLHASLIPAQIRAANTSMGKRMGRIVRHVVPDARLAEEYIRAIEAGQVAGSPAIVFGLAVSHLGVPPELVVRAFLMQLTTSITQNAIRGIPIGQDAGQRILAGTHAVVSQTVDEVMQLEQVDLGAAPPALELAQMHHETQRSRMFMS